jgi:hypothetical protein
MNAQMSTGPRSQSGKNISKFNNLRWGCYAKELILPGESAEELQERCERWEQDLQPLSEPERYEVFNAVHATWRQDRMRRAEAIALADLVDKTTEHFQEQKEQEARELIARLPESPGESIQGLRNSTAGLTWMIDQVQRLAGQVARFGGLTQSQRRLVIHLWGKRLVDLFVDSVVATWNRLYLAEAVSQMPDPPEKVAVAELELDRPPAMEPFEFEYSVESIAGRLPTAEEARAEMAQRLAAMLAELTERRELIGLREERDLARAIGKAKGDAGAETAKRQRVENSMDRQRRMSLKEFRSLVNSRPEPGDASPNGDGDGAGTPAEPGPRTGSEMGTGSAAPEHGEPGDTTAATATVVMPGSVAPVAAAAEAVTTAPAGTAAEADTSQKCKSEPTCQNGRRNGEAEAADAEALTRPSGTPDGTGNFSLSQAERDCGAAPDATSGATGNAISRPSPESVIADGGAKDDISETNRFAGGTGHQ